MPLTPQEIERANKYMEQKYGSRPSPVSASTQQNTKSLWDRVAEKRAASLPEQPQKTEEPGFFSRVGSDISKRAGEVYSTLGEAARGEINPLETGIRTVGQVMAAPADIIGEGIKSAYNIQPEALKSAEKGAVKSILGGQGGVDELKRAISVPVEAYQGFSEAHPRLAKDIEGVANIAAAFPEGKAVESAASIAKPLAKDVVESAGKSMTKRAISGLDKQVEDKFVKAIRPSVGNMATESASRSYLDRAKTAMNAIVENEPNLNLLNAAEERVAVPESLQHFSQAIDQTKKDIFKQYSAKAAQAGEQGAMVDLSGAAKELEDMAGNVVLQDKDPGLIESIRQKADILKKRGAYTPEQAQEAIKMYNDSLESFYKNPSYDTASKAAVDSVVANNLRSSLDLAVESISGHGYQELKNKYGALKTIEKDVAKRSLVDARKNAKGLLDFTDIATGAGAVQALLSMNPAQMASAAFGRGVKEVYKRLNDPNEIVKSLFKKVKSVKEKAAKYGIESGESAFTK